MRTLISRFIPLVLGAILVLGLPPVLLLTSTSPAGEPAGVPTPKDPLRALIAQQSTLTDLYVDWQKGYLAQGGDRNVDISVAWTDALSTERSKARGWVHLNLIDGALRAEVQGLHVPADLWLVDNQEGPGMTVQPQPGDRMVRIGRLQRNGSAASLSARFGPSFFRDFELDLVVVSRSGRTPAESSVLVGTRPFFERLYTQTRVAVEKARERNARLFRPAALLSVLTPRLAEADSTQILIAHGLVSQNVGDGADLFFRGLFGGNGRTCATCHRAQNNQGLDLDFISTLPPTDPLFVAEFTQGGVPGLERPLLMRGHAQILENVDGFEDPTVKFTMRGVPHTLSLFKSILAPADGRAPIQRTGWSGDGAPGTGALRLFPNGAVKQHFTKSINRLAGDFTLPTDAQLDKMEAFMLASGRLNELNLASVTLTNAGAQAGKLRFVQADARCNNCHANAGANVGSGTNNNFNTGVERAPDPSQATEPHPRDGGFGAAVTPNFDCDGNGTLDCFGDGTFNTPPLIEAADTEPFFHNNSFATIEDAVRFFTTPAFRDSPAGNGTAIPLSETDIQNIGAFLRVLNASFNAAISIQRNNAALTLENSSNPCLNEVGEDCGGGGGEESGKRETVNMLLALSNTEATDAIEVLSDRNLHNDAIKLLNSAISKNSKAINENASQTRKTLIQGALNDLNSAKAKFGTGLTFTLGEGNLLF